ncbi:bifunctional folylpolyglutamate synthase/dihydrofolate synthase [Brevibacterium sp. 50QC2O2]|uniref:bifunctional folylpolyglutamate synthase/dihydrofolate synthase n=1 Tax=Brevibacterium TaxID=1696 RepID=UPI00211C537F|nr:MULTISPECIES: folylpolyglutamate synthase/dihydrofolate synthase family protein [unclassified Brevibacterium]MCQ9384841.1 bifunctional folylpolyglutamate synthase/dihydrofolate synthase [Brevibacterium sp. 68QC2CO]MCQ9387606.1 bifunctional folylpolyglutamate synthase/dihydrofolate synthase [Brevibacterium sp. 50QC2O2]
MTENSVDEPGEAELVRVLTALQARAGETQVELRLDATRRACELLGDIHTAAPAITVTGTNGKTTTVRMVESLLAAADIRVGRFSSPHLHKLTERISVDGAPVADADFVRIYDEVEPYLLIVDGELAEAARPPLTYFEVLTILAFAVFADTPVDVYVLEVGMGGQWDSTNVADAQVCGFTPIGLDHMQFLGDTVTEIAATKAGILDRTVDPSPAPEPVAVIGRQDEEATAELARQVSERGVESAWLGRDFELADRQRAVDGQLITIRTTHGVYEDIFLPLHGAHQAENAAVALAIVERFLTVDQPLDLELVGRGFAQVTSPGRVETVRADPTIIVDGAHNPQAAAVLAETLEEAFDFRRVVAVVAMFADKDPHGVLEYVHRFADTVVVTAALNPRALPADELAVFAAEWWDEDDIVVAGNMNEALMRALDIVAADAEPGTGIVVTGSLATVAEARTLLGKADEV